MANICAVSLKIFFGNNDPFYLTMFDSLIIIVPYGKWDTSSGLVEISENLFPQLQVGNENK